VIYGLGGSHSHRCSSNNIHGRPDVADEPGPLRRYIFHVLSLTWKSRGGRSLLFDATNFDMP
jgi:hypothetical protein